MLITFLEGSVVLMISNSEWELINKIVAMIYSQPDSYSMRETFLKNLRTLIDFDVAEFSLINSDGRLYNSVEVNMAGNEIMDIAEKYNRYKDTYGQESIDYIFRYSESFIACNATSGLRGDSYKNTRFNTVFIRSIKMKYCCTMSIISGDTLVAEFSLYCSSDPDFSEREVYILSQFKEHLTNLLTQFHGKKELSSFSKFQYNYLAERELTERELQVSELLLSDMPNHNIADTLCISINTLKKHTYNIYRKLDISSRSQLKALLAENK